MIDLAVVVFLLLAVTLALDVVHGVPDSCVG
uniref:Uncharacterized protein n=1 Tax=Arundo donax TaxID=35708 RepID=A0A0A9A8W4_ARUDO